MPGCNKMVLLWRKKKIMLRAITTEMEFAIRLNRELFPILTHFTIVWKFPFLVLICCCSPYVGLIVFWHRINTDGEPENFDPILSLVNWSIPFIDFWLSNISSLFWASYEDKILYNIKMGCWLSSFLGVPAVSKWMRTWCGIKLKLWAVRHHLGRER